ncbi:MAG: gamma-glutamylcyclotransferase family protein [Pseudomonadota bacterium]
MTLPFDQMKSLAATGDLIAYFGYGSLVNPATHRTPVLGYVPARLRGWRRSWVARPDWDEAQPLSLLSASPSNADHMLDGLLVFDHKSSLPSLDEREAGYQRHAISVDALHIEIDVPNELPIFIYEAFPAADDAANGLILQSYLDAVLQGFDQMHGKGAISRFVDTTDNFHTPILKDRTLPRYPRSVELTGDQKASIDATLAQFNWVELARD